MILIILVFVLVNLIAFNQAKSMSSYVEPSSAIEKEVYSKWEILNFIIFGQKVGRPEISETPTDFNLNYSEHTINLDKEVTLSAWHIPHPSNEKIIIMFHGYSRSKSSLLLEAKAFWDNGYSIFIPDFRGGGESTLSYTTAGYLEADDVKAISDYVDKNLEFKTKVLFGHSMGAIAIFRAMEIYKVKADKLIVEAMYFSLIETVKSRVRLMGVPSFPLAYLIVFWGSVRQKMSGFSLNISNYAKNIETPILMLHGEEDKKAELRHAIDLFKAIKGKNKKFVVMPGLIHEPYYIKLEKQWTEEVFYFLKG